MNEYSIRLAKPHCEDCHKSKDGVVPAMVIPANTHLDTDAVGEPRIVSNEPVLDLAERLRKATQPDDEEI